jgi:hypothetical protein
MATWLQPKRASKIQTEEGGWAKRVGMKKVRRKALRGEQNVGELGGIYQKFL